MGAATSRDKKDFQPAAGLWKRYRPAEARYAFTAATAAEARRWQARTRLALARRIGLEAIPGASPRARVLEEVDKRDYVRQKLVIRTGPDTRMPVYLLLPKRAAKPLPLVLAFHGHGYGVKDIVGLWEDGSERDTPDGYHEDFAVSLCRAGFAVAAPEISCFGERQTDFSYLDAPLGQVAPSTCTHSAMLAFHLGMTACVCSTIWKHARTWMRAAWAPWGFRVEGCTRFSQRVWTRASAPASSAGTTRLSGTAFSPCRIAPAISCPAWRSSARCAISSV
jgi:hypothetical protein